jgi:mono/diheme cytochrome c family protein
VLLAITSGGKVGLGVLAGLLIAFAILSAFYFPRRNPDFPGNRLGLFILVSVVLFAGTMIGVVVFAAEGEEEHGAEATETHGTGTGEEPPTSTGEATTSGEEPSTSTGETTTTGPAEPEGDADAGEAVFTSAGCASCHTLEAAGATGTVGPNLDEAKPDVELVVDRVTNGKGVMPSFKGQLDDKQIQDVAAYVVASTQG